MAVNSIAMNAYQVALKKAGGPLNTNSAQATTGVSFPNEVKDSGANSFADTVKNSIHKVNEMQQEKSTMIQSFASGETQNVHELMIQMQKASLAMSMTSAVRNKVMESYKKIMQTQF